MKVLEAARLFNPCIGPRLNAQAMLGNLIQASQHFDQIGLQNMLAEIPVYHAAAVGIQPDLPDADILSFWRTLFAQGNASALCAAFKVLLLFPTSSAAAERVFSMMKAMIDDQQTLMLDDMMSEAIKQRFHSRGPHTQLYRNKASYKGVWDFVVRNITRPGQPRPQHP